MLKLRNVRCGYEGQEIIKGISFDVEARQNSCIIGPNGSGKTTLLRAISHIIPYEGEIQIQGQEIRGVERKDLARRVALLSQVSQVYFPYTVYETVALGRYAYSTGLLGNLQKEDQVIIAESLQKVGLYEQKDKLISQLSGGQLQRVFLARAFAQDPEVILLDEPTNHLDLKYQIELLDHLKEWVRDKDKVIIGVLHDLNLVQQFADQVILMDEGQVVAKGSAEEVLKAPFIKEVYGIDIKEFMIATLKKWQ